VYGNWLTELTGVTKPIIGMVHLPALPGTPLFDANGGMKAIREWVKEDLDALQAGGIDAVMFCNENDRPYRLDSDFASVAAMADVVGTMRESLSVPFGVNVLWDPRATLAVAKATGAAFCREIFTGAFAGDFGLWVRCAGDSARYRREISAENVRMLYNINAEFAAPIAPRPVADLARSVVPVLINTGFKASNAETLLTFADGAIVGSSLKVDGVTWNKVDSTRVKELMAEVRRIRA
jgi:membrane complex biogenesis BtpA family protein